VVRPVHDRVPVLLGVSDFDRWLATEAAPVDLVPSAPVAQARPTCRLTSADSFSGHRRPPAGGPARRAAGSAIPDGVRRSGLSR